MSLKSVISDIYDDKEYSFLQMNEESNSNRLKIHYNLFYNAYSSIIYEWEKKKSLKEFKKLVKEKVEYYSNEDTHHYDNVAWYLVSREIKD